MILNNVFLPIRERPLFLWVYIMIDAINVVAPTFYYKHTSPFLHVNTLRPKQNGRHFADEILKCTFLKENVWIPIQISLKFIPKGTTKNIPALFQTMAWRRPGDKPLSEPMMAYFADAYMLRSVSMS